MTNFTKVWGAEMTDKVDELIKNLGDEDPHMRYSLACRLKEIGKPAVTKLIDALKHRDVDVRSGAAYALGEIKR